MSTERQTPPETPETPATPVARDGMSKVRDRKPKPKHAEPVKPLAPACASTAERPADFRNK